MPDEDHSQIPAPQAGGIIKVVLLYATFSALWILLSDKAVEWLFQESWQITLASTFKGWLFVALTSLLLYGLMRRMIGRTADEAGSTQPNGMRPLIPLIPIAVVIVVLTAGSIVYTFKLGEQKEAGRLLAIADLKTGQIVDWLRERESDAHAVQNNRFFRRGLSPVAIGGRRIQRHRSEEAFGGTPGRQVLPECAPAGWTKRSSVGLRLLLLSFLFGAFGRCPYAGTRRRKRSASDPIETTTDVCGWISSSP